MVCENIKVIETGLYLFLIIISAGARLAMRDTKFDLFSTSSKINYYSDTRVTNYWDSTVNDTGFELFFN